MNVGQSLKACREKLGLSQSELARKTSIQQANISRWENGTHSPNITDCIILAKFYGVSIDELVGYAVNKDSDDAPNV